MADVAGGVKMNKTRKKSGKDMIKTTTLGKKVTKDILRVAL